MYKYVFADTKFSGSICKTVLRFNILFQQTNHSAFTVEIEEFQINSRFLQKLNRLLIIIDIKFYHDAVVLKMVRVCRINFPCSTKCSSGDDLIVAK